VIEDDPRFAAILADKCHAKGFKCLAAPSGEAGLELAARHQPHAVILDIRLPGMDGMTVLSSLKEDIRTRHIPVHVVSVESRGNESLRRGAVGHADCAAAPSATRSNPSTRNTWKGCSAAWNRPRPSPGACWWWRTTPRCGPGPWP